MIPHYRATRKPSPPPRRAGEEFAGNHVRHADALPDYASKALRGDAPIPPCECGQPATHLGRCTILGPHGGELSGGLFLCAACAKLVDKGVRVEALP